MRLKLSKKSRNIIYYAITVIVVLTISALAYYTYEYVSKTSAIQSELRSIQRDINMLISNYEDYGADLSSLGNSGYSDESFENVIKSKNILETANINLNNSVEKSTKPELSDYKTSAKLLSEEITVLLNYQEDLIKLNYSYAKANRDFQMIISIISNPEYDPNGFNTLSKNIDNYISEINDMDLQDASLVNYKVKLLVLLNEYKTYYSKIGPYILSKNFGEVININKTFSDSLQQKKDESESTQKETSKAESILTQSVRQKILNLEEKYKSLNADYK